MDKAVIDAFWRQRSAEGKGRWTDEALLRYEIEWLTPHVARNARILDLGSGPGELSSRLLPSEGKLTLVEKFPDFLERAPNGPNIRQVCCDILDFDDTSTYDLILLFGVVTHLSEEEEIRIYRNAAERLAKDGKFVVKNQVATAEEKLVSGYSESLHQTYCGRYPGFEQQLGRLKNLFANVDVVRYPEKHNPWFDTLHVAYICKA